MEDCDKTSKLDILHLRQTYQTKLQEKERECDQELQKLKETYEDKISGLRDDFHRSTMDFEAEVMKSYKTLEQRRLAEEELHTEIQHMESSHLIDFKQRK